MPERPKLVLVDVDGVCADLHTEWLRRYNSDFGDCLRTEDIVSWSIEDYVSPACGDQIFEYLHQPDLYQSVTPIVGARDGVDELRAMGYRVVFVTASNEVSAGSKIKWLAEHGFIPSIRKLEDVVVAYDKSLIHGHALIDDGVHNLETARVERRILFHAPHNASCEDYVRCKDWPAVVRHLDPKPFVGITKKPLSMQDYLFGEALLD